MQRIAIRTSNEKNFDIKISHKKIKLSLNSSYENTVEKFNFIEDYFVDYIDFLANNVFDIGWMTALPSTEEQFNRVEFMENLSENENEDYLKILYDVLHTLDPSIIEVKKSLDSKDAYVIVHQSNKTIIDFIMAY